MANRYVHHLAFLGVAKGEDAGIGVPDAGVHCSGQSSSVGEGECAGLGSAEKPVQQLIHSGVLEGGVIGGRPVRFVR
jgi:hypothetical protein